MINKALILFTAFLFLYHGSSAQGNAYRSKHTMSGKTGNITVEVRLKPGNAFKDSIQIDFAVAQTIGRTPYKWQAGMKSSLGGKALWNYYANDISFIKMPFMTNQYTTWVSEAGDNIVVTIDSSNSLKFSGVGADKFVLQHAIKLLREKMRPPTKEPILLYPVSSTEYFEWIKFLNEYEHQFTELINSYRGRVSTEILERIGDHEKDFIISRLKDLFFKLYDIAYKSNFKEITIDDVCAIYDTTVANKIQKWVPFTTDGFLGTWTILKTLVSRKYKFKYDEEPLKNELKRTLLLYEEGLKLFRDSPLSREQFLARLLTEEMLDDIGITPQTKEILDKYYAEPGYPEHKDYVKAHEAKRKMVRSGRRVPDFTLTDKAGRIYSNKSLEGKIVLMDFWFTGCAGCVSMVPVLRRIENEFKGDTCVVFLNVSADKDKDKWLKSISEKKYTTGQGVSLYTNGNGFDDYTLRALAISSYPSLYLLDQDTRIVENPVPDPRKDNGKYLIDLIHHKRLLQNDGPYIIYNRDSLTTYSVFNTVVIKKTEHLGKKTHEFNVQTDEFGKSFTVSLKKEMKNEPSEFGKPQKLLSLSDIEGNFDALRKLLQANKVIDEDFNWTFGEGHVVINGDVFDRGEQVTECLWLIYSLEEKAKAAGGYVHYILGNHEIMNLSGNHGYVKPKYIKAAENTGKTYAGLYGTDTELGRWLRTKNIIEKIGNLLFVHGGISKEMNKLNVAIPGINEIARPHYDKDIEDKTYSDSVLLLIYDHGYTLSPFWYRLYYLEKDSSRLIIKKTLEQITLYKASDDQVKETLKKYQVDHVVTGHTLVEPEYSLSVHYEGKVINTDTHHAQGKSEALLVEGKNYYRVDTKGERVLLFSDN